MTYEQLRRFVAESNLIEGIERAPTHDEVAAHGVFLALQRVRIADLQEFVLEVAGASLRAQAGDDVRVGDHRPPPGGPDIGNRLGLLLNAIQDDIYTPWEAHIEYETLHPFLDGNGRSGRILWAWQMQRDGHDPFSLPFLHRFYYQTLSAVRALGATPSAW